jgi:hypothetical protein
MPWSPRSRTVEESYELRLGYPDSPIVGAGGGARVAPDPPALRGLLRSPGHLLLVGDGEPAVRLVRPDAYVAFAGGLDEQATLGDVLGRTLGQFS